MVDDYREEEQGASVNSVQSADAKGDEAPLIKRPESVEMEEEEEQGEEGYMAYSMFKNEVQKSIPSEEKTVKEWNFKRRPAQGISTGLSTPTTFVNWDKLERDRVKIGRNAEEIDEIEEPRFCPYSCKLLREDEKIPETMEEAAKAVDWTLPSSWTEESSDVIKTPEYPEASFIGNLEVEGSFFLFFQKFYKLFGIVQDRTLFVYSEKQNVKGAPEADDVYGALSLRDRSVEVEEAEGKMIIKLINPDAEHKKMREIRVKEIDSGLKEALISECEKKEEDDKEILHADAEEGLNGEADIWYTQGAREAKRMRYRWAESMIARWRAKGCCRNSGYTELVRREIVRMGHAFFATAKSTDLVIPAGNLKFRGARSNSIYVVRRVERSTRFRNAGYTPFAYQLVYPAEDMAASEAYSFVSRLIEQGFDGPIYNLGDFRRLEVLKTLMPSKFRPVFSR